MGCWWGLGEGLLMQRSVHHGAARAPYATQCLTWSPVAPMRKAERCMELLNLVGEWHALDLDQGTVDEQQVALQDEPGMNALGAKLQRVLACRDQTCEAEETRR